MIKAVIDTNILISAFISPFSYPREIERSWRRGEFIMVTSQDIVEEINRVLHLPRIQGKYHIAESDIQAFILTLIHKSNCVSGELALKGVAPDPGDDKIISCAVEGEAQFIVTGDKSLQQIEEYQGIKIINAEQFIRVFKE
jgi:putative PIN family toxin of toxin-antitoxin system